MIVRLPAPAGSYTTSILATIFATICRAFGRVISVDEAVPFFLLQSPNGTVYRVTVSDLGVVTATPL